jgi:DNA-directed RNA polymerase subunit RPC12/RpoP
VNVTTGLVNSHTIEIRSGLQEGDQVIYAGSEMLKEGDPVVPTEWGPSGPLTLPPATGEEKAAPGTIYTCPMHPEVKMDKPVNCPKCGMKLQPMKAGRRPSPSPAGSGGQAMPEMKAPPKSGAVPGTPTGQKGAYYCPMHPEVQSDRPGKCPKCGMDLVLKPGSSPRTGEAR